MNTQKFLSDFATDGPNCISGMLNWEKENNNTTRN